MLITIFCISLFVGVLTGMIGIGGGVIILPVLVFFGFSIPEAVAISLFINMLPNALPGVILYYNSGHLRLKPALIISLATCIGICIGSWIGVNKKIPDIYTYRIFTLIIFLLSLYMFMFHCF